LEAGSLQQLVAVSDRIGCSLGEQSCLADPRLSNHQDCLPDATLDLVNEVAQDDEVGVTADEDGTHPRPDKWAGHDFLPSSDCGKS
jgi:hypothetical protein